MSNTFEIRREGEIKYAKPLVRALLRDGRLSFGARGLFEFLWDLPGGWRTNSTHLALMSPQGRDAIRTLLKELEAVGAIRHEAIRVAGGRVAGKRWILVAPERWAIETPLLTRQTLAAAAVANPTERRVFRLSEKPTIGKPDTKVLQGEGLAKNTTTEPQASTSSSGSGVFDCLIIEPAILKYLPQLISVLTTAGITDLAIAQDMCDELAGTINAGNIGERVKVGNPVLWLQAVVSGKFIRARCFEVQARRKSAKASAQQEEYQQILRASATAPIRAAMSYFSGLDDTSRDRLIEQFSDHLSMSNPSVFQFFRKNRIESKVVQTELFKFITNTILSVPTQGTLA